MDKKIWYLIFDQKTMVKIESKIKDGDLVIASSQELIKNYMGLIETFQNPADLAITKVFAVFTRKMMEKYPEMFSPKFLTGFQKDQVPTILPKITGISEEHLAILRETREEFCSRHKKETDEDYRWNCLDSVLFAKNIIYIFDLYNTSIDSFSQFFTPNGQVHFIALKKALTDDFGNYEEIFKTIGKSMTDFLNIKCQNMPKLMALEEMTHLATVLKKNAIEEIKLWHLCKYSPSESMEKFFKDENINDSELTKTLSTIAQKIDELIVQSLIP
jgi:hypothetical protein